MKIPALDDDIYSALQEHAYETCSQVHGFDTSGTGHKFLRTVWWFPMTENRSLYVRMQVMRRTYEYICRRVWM